MTRWLTTAGCALGGLVFTLAAAQLANKLRVIPLFPAFAGDDDFALRAGVFFLFVCPAFTAIGGAIGHRHARWQRSLRAWTGIVAGTLAAFAVVYACGPWIERIDSRAAANASALGLLVAWPLLAAAAALAAARSH